MNTATSAATAAITSTMGFAIRAALNAFTAVVTTVNAVFTDANAVTSPGIIVMTCPMDHIIFPAIINAGPNAATITPMTATMVFITGFRLLSQSIKFPTIFTASRMAGIRISPKAIASSDILLFRVVSCPFRLSCMIAVMFSAEPSQLSMALRNWSIFSGAAVINARNPLIAFCPTSAFALADFSASDNCENA